MIAEKSAVPWTFEAVEDLERRSGERYEFIDGAPLMMAGASTTHLRICREVLFQLTGQLTRGPNRGRCEPFGSDAKIRVKDPVSKEYRYPDISVFCGEPETHEGTTTLFTNPTLLFEVLSPSTKNVDEVVKLGEYTEIPSLQAYVIVEQEKKLVKMHRRTSTGWAHTQCSSGTLELPGAPAVLDIDQIYQFVE